MSTSKIAAIAFIVAGVLGLLYGGFTYTRGTQQANIGPIELSVKDTQTVSVPIWASVGAIAFGGVLLVVGRRTS